METTNSINTAKLLTKHLSLVPLPVQIRKGFQVISNNTCDLRGSVHHTHTAVQPLVAALAHQQWVALNILALIRVEHPVNSYCFIIFMLLFLYLIFILM